MYRISTTTQLCVRNEDRVNDQKIRLNPISEMSVGAGGIVSSSKRFTIFLYDFCKNRLNVVFVDAKYSFFFYRKITAIARMQNFLSCDSIILIQLLTKFHVYNIILYIRWIRNNKSAFFFFFSIKIVLQPIDSNSPFFRLVRRYRCRFIRFWWCTTKTNWSFRVPWLELYIIIYLRELFEKLKFSYY